ncbi:hypothetical protein ACFLU5_00620 [Bacteroidota bacterium]
MNDKKERTNCDKLLEIIDVMEKGLRASLKSISKEHLNHQFATHKMTIGQTAVHTMSWPTYFLAESPPWEVTELTCRPCTYPLTTDFVKMVISEGCESMRTFLLNTNDEFLEIDEKGKKGKGYILYRLQLHTLVHANQIAFLRGILDPVWDYNSHFGDMATALIALDYHTSNDLNVRGF